MSEAGACPSFQFVIAGGDPGETITAAFAGCDVELMPGAYVAQDDIDPIQRLRV
jgi:hypothetical protein